MASTISSWFRWTMAFQWGVTAVLVAGWLMLDRSLAGMGLELAADRWQWLAIGVAAVLLGVRLWRVSANLNLIHRLSGA